MSQRKTARSPRDPRCRTCLVYLDEQLNMLTQGIDLACPKCGAKRGSLPPPERLVFGVTRKGEA